MSPEKKSYVLFFQLTSGMGTVVAVLSLSTLSHRLFSLSPPNQKNSPQGIVRSARLVGTCMHRFCGPCIERWLRACAPENTCPSCREPLGSRRAARADARFDAVVAALYGNVDSFENGECEEGAGGKKALEAAIEEGKAVGRAIKAAAAERAAARKQGRSSSLANNNRAARLSAPPIPPPVAAQQIVPRPPPVASQVVYQQQQAPAGAVAAGGAATTARGDRGRGRPRKVNVAVLAASLGAASAAAASTSPHSTFTFLVPGLVPVITPVEGQRHPSVAAGPDAMPRPVPAAVPTAAAAAALGLSSGSGGSGGELAANHNNNKRAPSTDTNGTEQGGEKAEPDPQPVKKKRRSGTRPTKAQRAAAEAAAAAAAIAAASQPRAPPVVLIVSRPSSAAVAAPLPAAPVLSPKPPPPPPQPVPVPYSNPTPAQELADAAKAKARSDVAAAREHAVCGGGALFVSLAAARSSASKIPRPHALAPALAPASSLAALVAAQLEEEAGNGETLAVVVGASDVRLSLSQNGGEKEDKSDESLFGLGSSATIADIAAVIAKRQNEKAGRIHDALGPLKVWYSVGIKQ